MKSINYLILFVLFITTPSIFAQKTSSKKPLDLMELTITQIQDSYKKRELTIQNVVGFYLNQIDSIDKNGVELNAIISVNPDAMKIAAEMDKELKEGKFRGSLHGIPVILKDNIDTHDKMPTTAGSRALANSYPLQDSFIAKKLREAGAVIIGKANLSEWANFRGKNSTSGWSGVGGLGKNPYVLDCNTCGSSSGSAVSVSANLSVIAIGTETHGSIVCPSHINGVVGLKPTVGLVSRGGVIPISYSQDSPGPITRTVEDAAILLGSLTGVDERDDKTLSSEGNSFTNYTQFLNKEGLKGKRIGVITDYFGINKDVDSLYTKAIDYMESQGAELVKIDNILDSKIGAYSFTVLVYEFINGLNSYLKSLGPDAKIKSVNDLIKFNKKDTVELRYFGQEYLEMKPVSKSEYEKNLKMMHEGSRQEGIDKIMKVHNLDAIISATGGPAWKTNLKNGDNNSFGSAGPAAIAGYPNITVPMGFVGELPVGISFYGKAWSEPILLEIAYAYEQGTLKRKVPKYLKTID
ncbi:MAG: amidase [Flavobacteriaceae bacterium]|nr:amidase [Flavobacteriaceae bacterium]